MGVRLHLLSLEGQELILAGALISITLNPFVFKIIDLLQDWLLNKSSLDKEERLANPAGDEKYLYSHIILIGYGRVGRAISRLLNEQNIPFSVVEQDPDCVKQLRKKSYSTVFGDASEPIVLMQAHVESASMLVVTLGNSFKIRKVIQTARKINPSIEVVIRAPSEDMAFMLKKEISGKYFFMSVSSLKV